MSPVRGRGGAASGRPGKSNKGAKGARAAKPGRPAPAKKRGGGPPTAGAGRKGGARSGDRTPTRATGGTRNELGGDQVEGRQAVRELLLAGRRKVRDVFVVSDRKGSPGLDDICELALDLGVRIGEVSRQKLDGMARTEAPQGVVALAAPLQPVDLDDLARQRAGGIAPFLVALDGVTDPGNLGALLRTAECAGATGVVLPRHGAVHVTPTVAKAAAGAIEHLPIALVGGLPTALRRLHDLGVWVVGFDMGGDTELGALELGDAPVCIVLGAEGRGLGRLARERCDQVVSIPLHGALGSLNVAAAGAVATYEIARGRR